MLVRSDLPPVRSFKFADEPIDLRQEFFPAGQRTLNHQRRGLLRQRLFAGQTRPPPHLAVQQKGQPAHVALTARMPQVAEQIFEADSQRLRRGARRAGPFRPLAPRRTIEASPGWRQASFSIQHARRSPVK